MRSLLKFGFMLVAVLSVLSGCAAPSQVRLTGSPDIPGAEGVVKTSTSNDGNTKLDISVKHLAPPEKVEPERESTEPRVIPWAGIFDSGKPNLARDIDQELAKTWADAIIRHRG